MAVAAALRRAVIASEWSYEQLARRVGVSKSTLANWTAGRTDVPAAWLAIIARELDRPVTVLLGEHPLRSNEATPEADLARTLASLAPAIAPLERATPELMRVLREAERLADSAGR